MSSRRCAARAAGCATPWTSLHHALGDHRPAARWLLIRSRFWPAHAQCSEPPRPRNLVGRKEASCGTSRAEGECAACCAARTTEGCRSRRWQRIQADARARFQRGAPGPHQPRAAEVAYAHASVAARAETIRAREAKAAARMQRLAGFLARSSDAGARSHPEHCLSRLACVSRCAFWLVCRSCDT